MSNELNAWSRATRPKGEYFKGSHIIIPFSRIVTSPFLSPSLSVYLYSLSFIIESVRAPLIWQIKSSVQFQSILIMSMISWSPTLSKMLLKLYVVIQYWSFFKYNEHKIFKKGVIIDYALTKSWLNSSLNYAKLSFVN